jgi:ADP-L-glycero-D-manno-heptose 6-epimerase
MIIVTGGAGFIGSNLVRRLNQLGRDDILIVDSLKNSAKHLNLNRLNFLDFVDYHDFLDDLDLLNPTEIEVIFHQGACTNTMEYDGEFMMQVNYEFSKELLNYALENAVRLIYASSASVYGNGDNGFREERNCEFPINIYAYSKFLFDQLVRRMLPDAQSQIVGLRYFNVYGPQENHKGKMASVIFQFHNQIMETGELKLFEGSERFRRDFIFVNDLIDVNLHFLDHPEISGIFNCGTGQAESFQKIADIMKTLYERCEINYIPFPETLKGKYQAFTQADLTNLRKTGFEKTFTSLKEGVTAYVQLLKASNGIYMQ